jgi:hypothetical protein
MEDEQKVIIKFLMNDCIDSHEISTILIAQFGANTFALHIISFGCARYSAAEIIPITSIGPGDPLEITLMPGSCPRWRSRRSSSRALNNDRATVLNRSQEMLRLKSYCLRSVPHLLTDWLRAKCNEFV